MLRKLTATPAGLFLVIAGVNVGNYSLNLFLGRFLGPAAFAEAGILATLVLVLSFIALGFQLSMAKITAQIVEDEGKEVAASLLKWTLRKAFIIGTVLAVLVMLLALELKAFLQFDRSWAFLITAAGIPVYFVLSVQRGYLQGVQAFQPFSRSYIVEMAARTIGTVAGIVVCTRLGLPWVTEAVAAGFIISFIAGTLASVPQIETKLVGHSISPVIRQMIVRAFLLIMAYECTQIIISYSDSILVRHYHDDHTAGLYTALSLIGRMVYFATWSVVMLLIPKVVTMAVKGEEHEGLFYRYMAIVMTGGLVITLGCALIPKLLIQTLFGSAYIAMAPVLWKYALATTLFAASNVFAYYYMSINRYLPVALSAVAGFCQVLAIVNGHSSIEFIIHAQILIMSVLFAVMCFYHRFNRSNYEKSETSYRYALSTK